MGSIYWEIWAFRELKSQLAWIWIYIHSLDDYEKESRRIDNSFSKIWEITDLAIEKELTWIEKKHDSLLQKLHNLEGKKHDNIILWLLIQWKIFFIKRKISKKIYSALELENNKRD